MSEDSWTRFISLQRKNKRRSETITVQQKNNFSMLTINRQKQMLTNSELHE